MDPQGGEGKGRSIPLRSSLLAIDYDLQSMKFLCKLMFTLRILSSFLLWYFSITLNHQPVQRRSPRDNDDIWVEGGEMWSY